MKRIVHLIDLYPPYVIGGNEMLARDVVEALRPRGYEVHVLTGCGDQFQGIDYVHEVLAYNLDRKDELFLRSTRLPVVGLLRHHVFDPATYSNVRKTVRELQPDLIIVDNLYMASAAPLLAVRDAPCPVVALVADKWLIYLLRDLELLLKPESRAKRWLLRRYTRWIQPTLWRWGKPDEILSVSYFIKQFYIEAGFPADRITPTHLGVDTSLYTPRREPHSGDNHLEVIFAGQLWEGKGPQVLIQALGVLRRREPDLELQLRIIGRGSKAFVQHLREEIRRHGMEDRTILDGFVPVDLLAERLRSGDIYVFPSVWDEPFSITLVAAMASGMAVVATRTGGTPEAFEDGAEGILVPPGNAERLAETVLRLARDPALRNRLSRAAIQRVRQEWSFEAYVDRLEGHYLRASQHGMGRR